MNAIQRWMSWRLVAGVVVVVGSVEAQARPRPVYYYPGGWGYAPQSAVIGVGQVPAISYQSGYYQPLYVPQAGFAPAPFAQSGTFGAVVGGGSPAQPAPGGGAAGLAVQPPAGVNPPLSGTPATPATPDCSVATGTRAFDTSLSSAKTTLAALEKKHGLKVGPTGVAAPPAVAAQPEDGNVDLVSLIREAIKDFPIEEKRALGNRLRNGKGDRILALRNVGKTAAEVVKVLLTESVVEITEANRIVRWLALADKVAGVIASRPQLQSAAPGASPAEDRTVELIQLDLANAVHKPGT